MRVRLVAAAVGLGIGAAIASLNTSTGRIRSSLVTAAIRSA